MVCGVSKRPSCLRGVAANHHSAADKRTAGRPIFHAKPGTAFVAQSRYDFVARHITNFLSRLETPRPVVVPARTLDAVGVGIQLLDLVSCAGAERGYCRQC